MILKYVVVATFLIFGSAQLLQAKPIVEQFEEFGLPSWTASVVGVVQIAGAIGLLVNGVALPIAIGLVLVMIGAVGFHVRAKHPMPKLAPALIVLALTSTLAYSLWVA